MWSFSRIDTPIYVAVRRFKGPLARQLYYRQDPHPEGRSRRRAYPLALPSLVADILATREAVPGADLESLFLGVG